jgi:thymidylate kinase
MSVARGRKAHTVALIGGDGSGKSSVARRLVEDPRFEFTYVYMGPSLSSASHMLPTSRLVLRLKRVRARSTPDLEPASDLLESRDRPSSLHRFLARSVLQFSEVVHREIRVRLLLRRGVDVVFDRHILFEIWPIPEPATAFERARNTYARLLKATCRHPDRALLLVADPEVMLDRKGETDRAYLERRNNEWLEMAAADPSTSVVDANQAFDDVYVDVIAMLPSEVDRHDEF